MYISRSSTLFLQLSSLFC